MPRLSGDLRGRKMLCSGLKYSRLVQARRERTMCPVDRLVGGRPQGAGCMEQCGCTGVCSLGNIYCVSVMCQALF